MTQRINIVGARGGVGTTTIAAALAFTLNADGSRISVLGPDEDATRAVFAAPKKGDLSDKIFYNHDPLLDQIVDYKIVDHGTNLTAAAAEREGLRVLVVRNEYLSLRRVVNKIPTVTASGDEKELPFEIVIIVEEPGRALSRREVIDVLGIDPDKIIVVPVTDGIARAVDAGVLRARPAELRKSVEALAAKARARRAITHRGVA